jgi:hypothetical protein
LSGNIRQGRKGGSKKGSTALPIAGYTVIQHYVEGERTMAVEQMQAQPQGQTAQQRGTSFPGFALASSVEAVRLLQVHGGQATADHFASHLGYKGTNNGAYLTRVAAARGFGILTKTGQIFVATALGQRILHPVYPHDQQAALVEAFLSADLFRRIYEDFKGKELPPEFGMKNALRNIYGIKPERVNDAYRVLMESAETAGFFLTRNGARTHLIMPLVMPMTQNPQANVAPAQTDAALGGGAGSGGGGGDGPGYAQQPTAAMMFTGASQPQIAVSSKDAYLNALIRVFEKKAADGQMDEQLMQRIERLLSDSGT